jgi:hypothetical protein
MTGVAPFARAARYAVHDRDAGAVLEHACDLVPEYRARRAATELLDVRAAEPARAHAHEQAVATWLRQLGELREPVRVENDRAHRPIVGTARAVASIVT